jgi:hypothetical protein
LPPYPRDSAGAGAEFKAWRAKKDHNSRIYYVALASYRYITGWETLGHEPVEMKQVPGLWGLDQLAGGDKERGWEMLREATRGALAQMPRDGFVSEVVMKPIYDPFEDADEDQDPDEDSDPRDDTAADHAPEARPRGFLRRFMGS